MDKHAGVKLQACNVTVYCSDYRTTIDNWRGALLIWHKIMLICSATFDVSWFRQTYRVDTFRSN